MIEYISLVISLIAALAWIPSLIEIYRRPRYDLSAKLIDSLKLRCFKRFMDGQDRIGFVLILVVDFWLDEPQGGAFYIESLDAEVRFKGEQDYKRTKYLNEVKYNQTVKKSNGQTAKVPRKLVFPEGTNIYSPSHLSWNQRNVKILPLFIPGDIDQYSGEYQTIGAVRCNLYSGNGKKFVVDVNINEEYQEKGYVRKCLHDNKEQT